MYFDANMRRNLDQKSYSYSTSLHTFTVMSSWVFSYFKFTSLDTYKSHGAERVKYCCGVVYEERGDV